jgi:hypothetical protein
MTQSGYWMEYYAGRIQAHGRSWVSPSQRSRLAIVMICAFALGGCAKSKEDAQIELIECAGFRYAIPQSLWEPIYTELRNRGTEPVNLMAMGTLANAYRNTYTVTFGRGAEVSARWDKGVEAAKKLGEEGNVRRIANYLISCVGTMNDALR